MLKELFIKSVKWKVWRWCVPSLGGLVLILMFGSNYFNLDIKTSILLGVISLITLWLFRFLYLLCEALIKYCHNTSIPQKCQVLHWRIF